MCCKVDGEEALLISSAEIEQPLVGRLLRGEITNQASKWPKPPLAIH